MSYLKKETKENLISTIKNIIYEWIDDGTANILPNMSRSGQVILQLAYLSIFLISATYCTFSICISLTKYFQYDIVTSIEIIPENPANFPAVSFCNLKRFNKTNVTNAFIDEALKGENYSIIEDIDDFYVLNDILSAIFLKQDEKLKRSSSFEINEMLLQCNFNWISCNSDDFDYFFDPLYGNCYTFNQKSISREGRLPGPNYGLSVDFFVGNPNMDSKYEMNDGIIVVVHNKSTMPLLNNDRILVGTNAEIDLKVARTFISKLGPPYSDCIKNEDNIDSEFYKFIVNKLKMTYTQEYCFELCLQQIVTNECNCSTNWFELFENTSFCNKDKIKCSTDVVGDILSNKKADLNSNCVKKCPLKCETVEYKITTSRANYPTPWSTSLLSKHKIINSSGLSNDTIEKAVLRVHVYYESMTYTAITETESITALTLFSNIGGTLGLCLGISILSLSKVFNLIIYLLTICEKSIVKNKVETKIEIFTTSPNEKLNMRIRKGAMEKKKKKKTKKEKKVKSLNK